MTQLAELAQALTQTAADSVAAVRVVRGNELHCSVRSPDVGALANLLRTRFGAELLFMAAADRRADRGTFEVHYLFAAAPENWFLHATASVPADAPTIASLATFHYPASRFEREIYDRELIAELEKHDVDLVCLAGFMRMLSAHFVRAFPHRILNIHPSLLPAFPGLDAQQQALEHGVKITGCTVHLVDEFLDAGPIIVQAAVPVRDDDTVEALSARVLREEHRIYSEAIRIVLDGAFRIEGRRVVTCNRSDST
jgi:phosphoribosylglycinamide formyltransferase-1